MSRPQCVNKSSVAVISLPDTYKCSGAFTKVFRSSYESVPEQLQKCSGAILSLPEHFYVFRSCFKSSGSLISVSKQLRKCSGAVKKVFRGSYKSVQEQF